MISRLQHHSIYTTIAVFAISSMLTVSCAQKSSRQENAPASEVDLSQAQAIFDKPALTPPAANVAAVVAVVEGQNITQGDLNREVNLLMNRMRGQLPPEQIAQLRPQMLQQSMDTLITKILLRQAVAKQNVEIDDSEVEEAIERITGSMRNGMTLDMFLAQTGMTPEQFRSELTMDLRINKLLEDATDEIATPSDEELKAYYEENKEQFHRPESVQASHILIAFKPEDDDAAKAEKKKKAEELREKLLAGEDFAACASENSDCPSKSRGGDLGTFVRGQMVQPFEEAAFTQPTGEIGQIVETRFGYHIIKVTERHAEGDLTLDEVRDRLADFLRSQKRQRAAQDYVKNLKESADISYPQSPSAPQTLTP